MEQSAAALSTTLLLCVVLTGINTAADRVAVGGEGAEGACVCNGKVLTTSRRTGEGEDAEDTICATWLDGRPYVAVQSMPPS